MAAADPHAGQPVGAAGPPLEAARATVILLHGRGASAEDMLGLARALDVAVDVGGVAWRCPQAAGGTWYPGSFLAEASVNAIGVASAHAVIESLVAEALAAGIPIARIALGGFSQGACLATTHAARHPRSYGAVIGLTGGLIGPPGTDFVSAFASEPASADSLAGVPVLLASGDPDPHVPWTRVEETAAVLAGMGAAVETMRLPGRPHTVSLEEVRRARAMLMGMA